MIRKFYTIIFSFVHTLLLCWKMTACQVHWSILSHHSNICFFLHLEMRLLFKELTSPVAQILQIAGSLATHS